MAALNTIRNGVPGPGNTPTGNGGILTLEEWTRENASQLTGLSLDEIQQRYRDYVSSMSSLGSTPSLTNSYFTDNTGNTPTELNKVKPASNIDMLGATNMLTNLGIASGNTDVTRAGMLGTMAVDTFRRVRELKGLKGPDKAAGIGGIAGGAADVLDKSFFGHLRARNSDLTNGMNDAYDGVSSAIMTMGPYGAIIGGAMKVGGLASDALTAMGVGTDLMTTADKILDSKFLKLTPIGLANAIGAKKTDKFSIDSEVRSRIGGSYGGAYSFMDDAAGKANKKYGWLSGGARDDANRDIRQAKLYQGQIGRINKDAMDQFSIASSSSDLLTTNYMFNLNGGIDLRYIRASKEGGQILRIKKINLTFKKGGQLNNIINIETKLIEWQPVIDTWEPSIQEFKQGGKTSKTEEEPLSNQQNVIPEGALHARLHHMEGAEDLTKKGIPVVGNDGEQQAEIELNEIIFNLEVTKKLEELCKDGSDEAAIEAGKLLVREILFNTDDRTGLINTLKDGGKIDIEWEPSIL